MKNIFKDYKNVFTLLSGTVISQIIPIVASVAITRLFSSYEIGEVELFNRLSTFLIVVATLRYEYAIPLPKLDRHAFYIFEFSIRWNVIFFLLFQLGMTLAYFIINPYLGRFQFSAFYMLLPIFVFFMAFAAQSENWALRKEYYKNLTWSRIMNASGNSLSKIIFGLLNIGSIGLVFGNVIGAFLGNLSYIKINKEAFKKHFSTRKRRIAKARDFIDFPAINAPHTLVDITREILIVVVIGWFFGLGIVGFFAYAIRIIRIPISLIGVAFGQVYYQRASAMIANRERIMKYTLKNARDLLFIGMVPSVILFFFGEELFNFVFGKDWGTAGLYAEINAPALLILFVTSPMSRIPMLLSEQRMSFFITTVYNVLFIASLWILSAKVFDDFKEVLMVLTALQFVFYLFYTFWFWTLIKKYESRLD